MQTPCELALPRGNLFDVGSLRQVVHEENSTTLLQVRALISKATHHLIGEAHRGGHDDVGRGPVVLKHIALDDLNRSTRHTPVLADTAKLFGYLLPQVG